jgi:hypothetical protein
MARVGQEGQPYQASHRLASQKAGSQQGSTEQDIGRTPLGWTVGRDRRSKEYPRSRYPYVPNDPVTASETKVYGRGTFHPLIDTSARIYEDTEQRTIISALIDLFTGQTPSLSSSLLYHQVVRIADAFSFLVTLVILSEPRLVLPGPGRSRL